MAVSLRSTSIHNEAWDVSQPGWLEADTVAHCGSSLAGDFIWSVTYTDIFSQWTESRAVWNKGAAGVVTRTREIEAPLPFLLLGFDSDNGGEFLNCHLWRCFSERTAPVSFTRSRRYHKNDNAHVGQKNWSHARQLLGDGRREVEALLGPINALYTEVWNPLQNFFCPSLALLEKAKDSPHEFLDSLLITTRDARAEQRRCRSPRADLLRSSQLSFSMVRLQRTLPPVPLAFAIVLVFVAALGGVRAAEPVRLELPGIGNAFRVTERILSGSQPKLDVAFAALAKAGVKTIISVDGSRPDVEAAKKHGLRYVHLPFGYDGIPANRIAEFAKAAGPDAGTIFVHCHHGFHRGPAAAGVICEAVAGWSPAQAAAWLKQAGTSADYPGLYTAVREFRPPTQEEIARTGELPEVAKTPALVDTMVTIDEQLDHLKSQQRAGWNAVSENRERQPAHVATLLWEQLRELARTDDTAKRPEDFRKLLTDSERAAGALRDSLRTSPSDNAKLDRTLKQTTQSCAVCHKAYRNEKK